jgi:hypothetical protein
MVALMYEGEQKQKKKPKSLQSEGRRGKRGCECIVNECVIVCMCVCYTMTAVFASSSC